MSKILISFVTGLVFSITVQADTTYTYDGPAFAGSTDHLSVTFTTTAPLAASTSYIDQTTAGVIAGSVSVVGPNGPLTNFILPITSFQVHTDTNGAIDSWYIAGDYNTLVGTDPTMTGTDWQAYTMNTLAFIPGSDIPGAVGLVTGNYDYDQGTETTFYTSCNGAPSGCTLAGNGQPYVGNYSGIINPSNTNGSWWTSTTVVSTNPPPPSVVISVAGSLPGGQVNTAYSASLTSTGGTAPYIWLATGLPAGLTLDNNTGKVFGTPTASGTNNVVVTATDSTGAYGQASYTVSIAAPSVSCIKPSGATGGLNSKGAITAINGNVITFKPSKGAQVTVTVPSCAKIQWNGGATAFALGQVFEWNGYYSKSTGNVAQSVTIN